MSNESEVEYALLVAQDVLAAGAKQLKLYDPEKENPFIAVARIYYAMEMARVAIERSMLADMQPLDKNEIN
jgi:hypothetical protein